MMNRNHSPGSSGLPPEYSPGRAAEYHVNPGLEYPELPPEYDQHGGASEPQTRKKRRNLRYFLLLPALVLLGFLSWKSDKAKASDMPEPEYPEGTVVIDVVRAGIVGDSVHYSYSVYTPIPSLDATPEQIEEYKNGTPWPISVYAKVTDENGKTAAPEVDPDVWETSRALFDYEINVSGLQGDLTLTLLALYEEQDEQRQTMVTIPLEELPMEPTVDAHLEVFPGGDVEFTATLIPPPGSDHEYDLQVCMSGQYAYLDGEREAFSLLDDPRAVPVTGDSETGFTAHYSGGSAAIWLPEEAELSLYVVFEDQTDGKQYPVESNRVSLYGIIEEEHPDYPLGDGTIVISVFNDTTTFEYPDLPVAEDGYRTLLETVTIPEAEFEEYQLPSAWVPDGYDFAGWVIHVGNPLDPGGDHSIFSEYGGDPPVEAMIPAGSFAFRVYSPLRKEDVEKVPPSEDGVRYVNLHAVWIKKQPRDDRLLLSNGSGGFTAYDMMVPLASEGFIYLCNYPVPEWDGMEFDGWYDEFGNRVDMLVCYFSFTPVKYDENGDFAGYDWNEESVVTLIAHWK